jgi:hypothetical protein
MTIKKTGINCGPQSSKAKRVSRRKRMCPVLDLELLAL